MSHSQERALCGNELVVNIMGPVASALAQLDLVPIRELRIRV